jgi:hypothetical protein
LLEGPTEGDIVMTDPRKPGLTPAETTGTDQTGQTGAATPAQAGPDAVAAPDSKPHTGLQIGEWTGMLTGHSTLDPDTTRPGSKTTGPGELGNFMKNQKD